MCERASGPGFVQKNRMVCRRAFRRADASCEAMEEMPRGSHFGALEEPAPFASDVTEFFRELRA
jgi:hypothetical protein